MRRADRSPRREETRDDQKKRLAQALLLFVLLAVPLTACQNTPNKEPSPKSSGQTKPSESAITAEKAREADEKKKAALKITKEKEAAKQKKIEAEEKARLKAKADYFKAKKKLVERRNQWAAQSKLWKDKGDTGLNERIQLSESKVQELESKGQFKEGQKEAQRLTEHYKAQLSMLETKLAKKVEEEKALALAAKAELDKLLKASAAAQLKPGKKELSAQSLFDKAESTPESERRDQILAYRNAASAYKKAAQERTLAWKEWTKKEQLKREKASERENDKSKIEALKKEVDLAKETWLNEAKRWGIALENSMLEAGATLEKKAQSCLAAKDSGGALTAFDEAQRYYRSRQKAILNKTERMVFEAQTEAQSARKSWRDLLKSVNPSFLARPEEATQAELAWAEAKEIQPTRPRKSFQKYKMATELFKKSSKVHKVAYQDWQNAQKPKAEQPSKKEEKKEAPVKKASVNNVNKPEDGEAPKAYTKMEDWPDAMAILSDRRLWNASVAVQDRAIDMVKKKLGPAFQWLETKKYQCQGLSHRIATFKHLKTGLLLQLLPGGRYHMGSVSGDDDEKPVHEVTIGPMLVSRHELRISVWNSLASDKLKGESDLPVSTVTWEQAQNWLKLAGDGLRLPSESEWEYSCRAGSKDAYFWGSKFDESYCWTRANTRDQSKTAQSVMAHFDNQKWNSFGLVDMSGNVFEWCADTWIDQYKESPSDGSSTTKEGPFRVMRGGAWIFSDYSARSSFRGIEQINQAFTFHGLRVFKSLPK